MSKWRIPSLIIAVCSLTVLTACGGGSSPSKQGGSGGKIRVANTLTSDPISPLTVDTDTTRVMDLVWTGLVRYDDKLKPYNAGAKSISTKDAKTFDITLQPDYAFSDGTPVTADSYINTWNWAAYGPHAAQSASYFNVIQGYDALNPPTPDGAAKAPAPTSTTLTGLHKVSTYEFTVTLAQPMATFPAILGYSVFYPLPKSFFANPTAYNKKPIGNGPYTISRLVPGQEVDLAKNAKYKHADAGKAAEIDMVSFSADTAAYTAVQGGQLDYAAVPTADLRTYKSDFPGRNALVTMGGMMDMQLPLYVAKYKDPNVRIAIALAIDRATIAKTILPGAATPADGWVSPALPGYAKGACGSNCSFDPARAKQLWAKTNFTGDIQITTLSPQVPVFTAVCQSITDVLKVPCKVTNIADRTSYKNVASTHTAPGPIRWGWAIDYPTMQNMLGPRFQADGSSNWMDYNSTAFQSAMDKANAESDATKAATDFNAAQGILGNDMPDVPIYFTQAAGVWSSGVKGLTVTGFGWPDLLKASK